ncbi:bifunctional 3-(3-hydroxy-phenyl)propionate/3-hydroxycinnamic acid hydroxylase [Halopseudomonas xiamenensis]|uniref:bifunctional 3-(3-hydroxy-phenyl)propionate/3-hydroxycinnamic acid hydroxylase n=1 Tax=Halopseudomonas xiamenensis TaxID=157792 RepID=UPI0016281C29|nr:bifunctional 3-(3-hydroxy-phenyl)propionate/3-hydroxycinnamic acid hydroxylase [Halopseudomonas xiamenensis]
MDYDLIIVGMGPVGATAANLAGQWGLKTLALDKSDVVFENPRAMGFDQEVMRTFDNIGIADTIASHVMPYRASHYLNAQARLIRHIDAAKPPHLLGWAPNYVFTQPPVEKAIRANLGQFPHVDVLLGTEVIDVQQQGAAVSVQIRSKDGETRDLSCAYVLACDGGTSPIRTQLGLQMEDLAFDEPWLVVDVLLKEGAGESLPTTNVQYCETARPSTFVIGPGRHRRWEFMINPGETPTDISRPEAIQHLISRWLPAADYDIWRASTYRFHALVLQQWQRGRVFFLGDAAHMTPPFLAQGMCQGIRDAVNLLWKIAMVHRGNAASTLLDSYQKERAPHVRRTTEVAKELGQIICERDPTSAAERDHRLLQGMNTARSYTVRQALIPGLQDGLIADSGPAGELFPQPQVTNSDGKVDLLDRFTGQTFRLVIASAFPDSRELLHNLQHNLNGHDLPITVVQLTDSTPLAPEQFREHHGLLKQWMTERGCQVLLVRPDHYLYGGAESLQDAILLLERLLGDLHN